MTKILLVEDDKSLREIYGVRLLAEGYDIVSAGDGEEALAMAIKEKPQLIISDVMMPKISGFDMLDILRSTTETKDIKVIMMTALSSDDQRARGEQLGADKYLVKSQVGIEDVVRTVHEVLDDKNGVAAAVASAAATSSAPVDTPAPATPAADSTKPADDAAKPADDAAPSAAETSVTPGNEGAGPLPPQPTEVEGLVPEKPEITAPEPAPAESSLPEPTAPFSSPRPANLGENVLHPEAATELPAIPPMPTEEEVTETPADVSTPPVTPDVTDTPAVPSEPATEAAPSLESPQVPEVPEVPEAPETPPAEGPDQPPASNPTTPVV